MSLKIEFLQLFRSQMDLDVIDIKNTFDYVSFMGP